MSLRALLQVLADRFAISSQRVALANNEEEEDFIFVPGETGLELPVRGQAYSGHINIAHDKKAEDRG